jgi:membrane carboxypeptidase/penicillin-binding protein
LNEPVDTHEGLWLPDDEHSPASSMTLRTALRRSSNRAAVRVLETVGIDRAVTYAKRLGVGTVPSVPSLALGSGEVTLASMTAAYAAFADGGIVREPVFIRRVESSDGTVLFQGGSTPTRAISETTAFLMASMLADVVNAGTANRARALGFTLPAGGKTGTSNEFVDAWFVGFTPSLVAGVWVGFDTPRTIAKNAFAGELAVPIWAAFMKAATRHDRAAWLRPPRDVIAVAVCRLSGSLPVEGCGDAVYTEYFVRGTEPRQTCDLHAAPVLPFPESDPAATAFEGSGETLPAAVPAESLPALR